jgi:hypothetical protein
MWTYDIIMIHKNSNGGDGWEYVVYASNELTLKTYADETGMLMDFFKDETDMKEPGVYVCEVGYGPRGANQDPTIYNIIHIGNFSYATGKIEKINKEH